MMMKIFFMVMTVGCGCMATEVTAATTVDATAMLTTGAATLVPVPARMTEFRGLSPFVVTAETRAVAKDPQAAFAVVQFNRQLREQLPNLQAGEAAAPVVFRRSDKPLGKEAYELKVQAHEVTVAATAPSGWLYGAQTLLQMLPPGGTPTNGTVCLPPVTVADEPRYEWRGMMIDCARHWWPMDELKKVLDLMASLKLNTFHWHLTDDQGWRLEIRKYPKLTEIGAWRDGVGFKLPTTSTTHYRASDGMYGGFYSQSEARELVEYAAQRGITVVPEIEIPGHASAMLHCYPQLGCTGEDIAIRTDVGGTSGIMCAGNDATLDFCRDVLTEVVEIFPSDYIHIGGDEARKSLWKKCPKCQRRIKEVGADDENALQNWMVKQLEGHLQGLGRKLIGWDEIIDGDTLTSSATVMVWRAHTNSESRAVRAGHEVVIVPEPFVYFDHMQSRVTSEPRSRWRVVDLETVYGFEPHNTSVPQELHSLVKGGQANLWTEYIPNEDHLEYMLAPRICALAEVLWSPAERRHWADFRRRLETQMLRLDAMNFRYRPLDPVAVSASDLPRKGAKKKE